jgi:hypothetical protein
LFTFGKEARDISREYTNNIVYLTNVLAGKKTMPKVIARE